ncbi:hypothetical protein ACMC56_00920 [Campylobacterota bacterium DY0563]|uniref:hypothetical protein n=1 Tax=Halarcobacter sp. TaxID=2321133 RepID=UPI0029F549F6|nr:hypothetical protein [Halarcobacter sp.]
MNPLQYTSKEMFSSTELIRKNKMIFDKLSKDEIDKAIILRDGKPSFMLLEFSKYEELMNEYINLKKSIQNKNVKTNKIEKVYEYEDNIKIIESEPISKEIDDEDLASALKEIENLEIEEFSNENIEDKKEKDEKEPLKEFWE